MVAAPDQNGQNAPLFGQKRSLKRVKLDRGGTSLLIHPVVFLHPQNSLTPLPQHDGDYGYIEITN